LGLQFFGYLVTKRFVFEFSQRTDGGGLRMVLGFVYASGKVVDCIKFDP